MHSWKNVQKLTTASSPEISKRHFQQKNKKKTKEYKQKQAKSGFLEREKASSSCSVKNLRNSSIICELNIALVNFRKNYIIVLTATSQKK